MASLKIDIGARLDKLKTGLANAQGTLKGWYRQISGLTKIAIGVSIGSATAMLAALAKRGIKLASDFQQTQIAFKTMLGDGGRAADLLAKLTEFSTKTPFSPEKVQQSAKTLLAFGFTASEIVSTLKFLGDVSSGTGKDLQELAVIFGQIKGAGRLMGQDLLQLINAGFNPLQVISEKTGKSMLQLKEDMSKGLITFDMVEQAFKDATSQGGLFFDMMEEQSKTLAGRFSTLKGNFDELLKSLASGTTGPLGELVSKLNKLTETLLEVNGAMQLVGASREDILGGGSVLGNVGGNVSSSVIGFQIKKMESMLVPEEIIAPFRKLKDKIDSELGGVELGAATQEEIARKRATNEKEAEEKKKAADQVALRKSLEADEAAAKAREIRNKEDIEMGDFFEQMENQMHKDMNDSLDSQLQQKESMKKDELRKRAAELEKEIGTVFTPQGAIGSRLARIGGEAGISVDRNLPREQLLQLQAIKAGIEGANGYLSEIASKTPAFP